MVSGPGADGFRHEAAFYRDAAGYRSAVLAFVREGLHRAEAVLVAVPGPAAKLIQDGLDGHRAAVSYVDMTELGRNPGRVISAIWDFADRNAGRPVRFVSELAWPGRSDAEIGEVAAHEAMLNLAFAAGPATLLCPYDTSLLAPGVIAGAGLTHPFLRTASGVTASARFQPGPGRPGSSPLSVALPPPPAGADRLDYARDLHAVRAFATERAERAGLNPDRAADLTLAVGEVAANTVRHAGARGTLLVWTTGTEIICQASDHGQILDPLVGRRRPPETGGLGLWVVHQVCDLVELRSEASGTVVRMHMLLDRVPETGGPS